MKDNTSPETGDCIQGVSRRTFLTATGVTVLAGIETTLALPTERDVSSPVLEKHDLLVPHGEVYVEWRVDPTTAPLLNHLVERTGNAAQHRTRVSGFVARRGVDVPQFVETAAVPTDVGRASVPVHDAVSEWFATTHDTAASPHTARSGELVWHHESDGRAEAVRLRPLGDWLLFVCSGGSVTATLSPEAATQYYSRLLAERAEPTSEGTHER